MSNKKVLSKATRELNKVKAPSKPRDIIYDPMGQWAHPGQPTRIPGNNEGTNITMGPNPETGTPITYPVWAQPNVGQPQMMYPGQDYNFPEADYVDEYPQMKRGGLKKNKTSRNLMATNKLFAKHAFFKKPGKNVIFDPNSPNFQDGGFILELDDDEIQAYKDGGYIVEDISVPELQDGGELYTIKGNNSVYRKVNGKWEVDTNRSGKFQPLSKGDIKERTAVLNKQAKPLFDPEYQDRVNTQSEGYKDIKSTQPKKQLTTKDKKSQENFDKNFKVNKDDRYTEIQNKIKQDQQGYIELAKQKGFEVTQDDLNQMEERGWNVHGNVGVSAPRTSISNEDLNPENHISTQFPKNATVGDYAQRGWEYLTNPGTAAEYVLGNRAGSMPYNINQLKEQGVEVTTDGNILGKALNILNPLDDIESIRSGANQVMEGNNAGYATAGLGLFGFIPGLGDARKLGKAGKTVSKIDDDLLEAYNLAADLKRQGKISKLPDTPEGFDNWLQSQYNQRPIYRVVDVNQDVVNNPVIKNNMIKQGLDPNNEYHVAEYMGTSVAPAEVINRGRRSGGHDELLKGSNKDILYFAEDPSWIGPRYGGNNPYYVKTFADELPTGYKNQVLGLRSNSRMKKNYSRNYPGFDINQVPSGVLFEDKVLSVGPNTITPILGDKGAKVRKVANIVKGSDFDRLPNKRFNRGGYVDAELTPKEIEWYKSQGYTIEEL